MVLSRVSKEDRGAYVHCTVRCKNAQTTNKGHKSQLNVTIILLYCWATRLFEYYVKSVCGTRMCSEGTETMSYRQSHPEKAVAVDTVKADLRKQTGGFSSRDSSSSSWHIRIECITINSFDIPRKTTPFSRTVIICAFCCYRRIFVKRFLIKKIKHSIILLYYKQIISKKIFYLRKRVKLKNITLYNLYIMYAYTTIYVDILT